VERGGRTGATLSRVANDAFIHGARHAGIGGAAVAAIGVAVALRFLPGRSAPALDPADDEALALAATDPMA